MVSNRCDVLVPCKLSLIELGSKLRVFYPGWFHLIYLLILLALNIKGLGAQRLALCPFRDRVHALLGAFSSSETESNEEIIINGSRPNRVRCSQHTSTGKTLIWFDLFSKFIIRWVNSIQKATFLPHPDCFFGGKNITCRSCARQICKCEDRIQGLGIQTNNCVILNNPYCILRCSDVTRVFNCHSRNDFSAFGVNLKNKIVYRACGKQCLACS